MRELREHVVLLQRDPDGSVAEIQRALNQFSERAWESWPQLERLLKAARRVTEAHSAETIAISFAGLEDELRGWVP